MYAELKNIGWVVSLRLRRVGLHRRPSRCGYEPSRGCREHPRQHLPEYLGDGTDTRIRLSERVRLVHAVIRVVKIEDPQ